MLEISKLCRTLNLLKHFGKANLKLKFDVGRHRTADVDQSILATLQYLLLSLLTAKPFKLIQRSENSIFALE